jgi:hypothetical protein
MTIHEPELANTERVRQGSPTSTKQDATNRRFDRHQLIYCTAASLQCSRRQFPLSRSWKPGSSLRSSTVHSWHIHSRNSVGGAAVSGKQLSLAREVNQRVRITSSGILPRPLPAPAGTRIHRWTFGSQFITCIGGCSALTVRSDSSTRRATGLQLGHQGSFFWLQNTEGESVVGGWLQIPQPEVPPPYFAARKKNPVGHRCMRS